jgi:amino-acid N-acetyltransferase
VNDLYIRKARVQDMKQVHALLLSDDSQGLILPRSLSSLYGHVRDFFVVASRTQCDLYGCCALAVTWEDMGEVRSLAVAPEKQRQGLGAKLVEACLSEAVTLGIPHVFTLTYQLDFFKHLGFSEVAKDVLPQKVWADCLHCPKFPDCDETAMLIDLVETPEAEPCPTN